MMGIAKPSRFMARLVNEATKLRLFMIPVPQSFGQSPIQVRGGVFLEPKIESDPHNFNISVEVF